MKKNIYLYCLFLLIFLLFSYLFIDPNFFYLHAIFTNFSQLNRSITSILFLLFLFVFFGFYVFFLKQIDENNIVKKDLIFLIILQSIILLFSYPAMVSFDIFNYIATAKVIFFYHENPYIIMPIAFRHDPLLLFMHAANKTALYGPVWILLTGIPFLLGFGNFLLILFTFKLFIILCYCGTLFLLWKMTKSLKKVAFFACNPLVVIEILVSGHNDIVMMFFFLFALYFFFTKNNGKTSIFYILSVGIKYATLIALPLFGLKILKKWSQEKFFQWTTVVMICIFFLSAFREEIYPWYAVWFMIPGTFLIDNTFLKNLFISFSFGLLLMYIPFMLLGTYFGPTPLAKTTLMVVPVLLYLCYFAIKKIYEHYFF